MRTVESSDALCAAIPAEPLPSTLPHGSDLASFPGYSLEPTQFTVWVGKAYVGLHHNQQRTCTRKGGSMTSLVNASSLVDVTAAAFGVASVVQLTKFVIDYIVNPANANHNSFVRLYVYLVAIIVVLLYASANTAVVFTGQFITSILTAVLTVGSAALLQYHLLTGLPSPTPVSTTGDSPTKPVDAVPVTPPTVEAVSNPASDPAQRI